MYPPFFKRFEEDFNFFNSHNFMVHVRRFRGMHEGRFYPDAYSDQEMQMIARYCDDATIRYMLSNEPTTGKLSWTGSDFCLIDNMGNVGYCDDYPTSRAKLGNVFEGNVKFHPGPIPFPGPSVSDGTVDGVANICELDYPQLEGNHIIHFSRLGGVERTSNGWQYKNQNTDFNDSRVRAYYRFPIRNFEDFIAVLKLSDSAASKFYRIACSLYPSEFGQNNIPTPKQFVHRMLHSIKHLSRKGLKAMLRAFIREGETAEI
jgi:hypothetical protein